MLFLILIHVYYAPSSLGATQSNWLNSSGYDQTIHEKNLQLTEL